MVIELAVRAQDEANRTVGEASAEGAEIIADARRQAAAVATAQQHLGRWQAYLAEQSEQLRADAVSAGEVSARLRAVLGE